MIIFDKFGLTEDETAFLKQQQAEAVERAVLAERSAQLELRLQESQTYGTRALNAVFETFGQIRKLTGADEDRVHDMAQILQAALEIWRGVAGGKTKEPPPEPLSESPFVGFRVYLYQIASMFAAAQGHPDLADALECRLYIEPHAYKSAADVFAACDRVWGDLIKEEGEVDVQGGHEDDQTPSTGFDFTGYCAVYADRRGNPDLVWKFMHELEKEATTRQFNQQRTHIFPAKIYFRDYPDELGEAADSAWRVALGRCEKSSASPYKEDVRGEPQDSQGGEE